MPAVPCSAQPSIPQEYSSLHSSPETSNPPTAEGRKRLTRIFFSGKIPGSRKDSQSSFRQCLNPTTLFNNIFSNATPRTGMHQPTPHVTRHGRKNRARGQRTVGRNRIERIIACMKATSQRFTWKSVATSTTGARSRTAP